MGWNSIYKRYLNRIKALYKNTLILLTGSNQNNPKSQIFTAKQRISTTIGNVVKTSCPYKTKAWGNEKQDHFINQALYVETLLPPKLCLKKCLEIELQMGRKRNTKWEPRIIDIDIMFYNRWHINETNFSVPHPHIQERNFALACLNDIIPNFVHPTLNKTIRELWKTCKDHLEVSKL